MTRAIDGVEDALTRFGAPVYVRRPIVHNLAVVRSLEAKGAIFVEELDQVPDGAIAIMSAHGVPRDVTDDADRRGLRWFDAICPLVAKVHREVVRHHKEGRHVILVGHDGHPEISGTLGQIPHGAASVVRDRTDVEMLSLPDDAPVAYAIQTTYSVDDAGTVVDAILARFDDVRGPPGSDICYATTNRQAAIRTIAVKSDVVIIAGESFSSNASRLAEVARTSGCASVQLVADVSRIDWSPLSSVHTIGLTAAASTPEKTVSNIVEALRERFDLKVEEVSHTFETTTFKPLRFD